MLMNDCLMMSVHLHRGIDLRFTRIVYVDGFYYSDWKMVEDGVWSLEQCSSFADSVLF